MLRFCSGLAAATVLLGACVEPVVLPPPPPPPPPDGFDVSEATLLFEMVDPDALARWPEHAYITRTATSFNRASLSGRGTPGWFANFDAGYYERVDGEELVLMEVEGPGSLMRIWSANPSGIIRIYLDGASEPVIEEGLNSLLHGGVEGFEEPFGFVASHGFNFYYPIPFSNGARVTVTALDAPLFYHVSYRSYTDGARVQSYGVEDTHLAAARAHAIDLLNELPMVPYVTDTASLDVGDAAPLVIAAHAGGSVARTIRIDAPIDEAALRGAILTMTFDGEATVRVPLGDFFGSGPGRPAQSSLMTSVSLEGLMEARWSMPFATEMRLAIDYGGAPIPVEIDYAPLPFDESSLLFHAHWRAPTGIMTNDPTGEPIPVDWPIAELSGQGRLVGVVLNVADPHIAWWGEGDEKIEVDGEDFPSTFGTGTEDFFGYAWCSTQLFDTPFIGQTQARRSDNAGRISLYRWMLGDSIPFRTSLRFDQEILHWNTPGVPNVVSYDAMVVWYARPGGMDMGPVPSASEFVVPTLAALPPDGPDEQTCGTPVVPGS